MADWRFEFVDSTTQGGLQNEKLSSEVPDVFGSGANDKPIKKPNLSSKKTFDSEFEQKVEKTVMSQYIVSPLNTVTGGMASPLYQSAKKLARGATIGAVAGDLVATGVLMAVNYGLSELQKRIQQVETQVTEMGNTDNALIRAGSVSKVTYYTGNVFGIKSRTDRS